MLTASEELEQFLKGLSDDDLLDFCRKINLRFATRE